MWMVMLFVVVVMVYVDDLVVDRLVVAVVVVAVVDFLDLDVDLFSIPQTEAPTRHPSFVSAAAATILYPPSSSSSSSFSRLPVPPPFYAQIQYLDQRPISCNVPPYSRNAPILLVWGVWHPPLLRLLPRVDGRMLPPDPIV